MQTRLRRLLRMAREALSWIFVSVAVLIVVVFGSIAFALVCTGFAMNPDKLSLDWGDHE